MLGAEAAHAPSERVAFNEVLCWACYSGECSEDESTVSECSDPCGTSDAESEAPTFDGSASTSDASEGCSCPDLVTESEDAWPARQPSNDDTSANSEEEEAGGKAVEHIIEQLFAE